MIKNFIKVAFRGFGKHKAFTAINILGLSVGIAICSLIAFYVTDELGYDRYNIKADRIYRVNLEVKYGGKNSSYAAVQAPMADRLKSSFPTVEQVVRLRQPGLSQPGKFRVKKGDENILEGNIIYADSTLFSVFTFPMIDGYPSTALSEPNTAVITERTARKYFGRTDVVGKTMIFNDTSNYKITGVIRDIPGQSHFNYDFFLSLSTLPESNDQSWTGGGYNTYVLLKPGVDYKTQEALFSKMMRDAFDAQLAPRGGMATYEKNGNHIQSTLSPLTSIHLQSDRSQELGRNSSMQYVYIFSTIAVIILLIACVNFINLSTARTSNRALEVGVRKVLGSTRKSLIIQFLTESFLIAFFSAVIAIILTWLLLPLFNDISGKELIFTVSTFVWWLPSLLLLVIVIGFIAGAYPAFFLSSFQPIAVLKGKLAAGFKDGAFRNILVTLQFAISIFLIIGTLVIYSQLKYIQSKSLGYNRDQLLIIQNLTALENKAQLLKQEITQLPGVSSATLSSYLPTSEEGNVTALFPDAAIDRKKAVLLEFWPVDQDYIRTLGMQLTTGRFFSNQIATDSFAIVLNEAAARQFGFFKNPLNKELYRHAGPTQIYHVIGIVKDFHFKSLRENITPLALTFGDNHGVLSIKIHTANMPALLSQIESKWKDLVPDQQFSYSFMDQDFNANYRVEQRIGDVFVSFTTIAIAIACLGLFGLSAYAAEQRTREIGIRKVLGASIYTIIGILSRDFIRLIVIAILIASPCAWFLMHKWLQDFAYRVSIPWWTLPLAGLTTIFIAFITISFQSIKAALVNPIESLKVE